MTISDKSRIKVGCYLISLIEENPSEVYVKELWENNYAVQKFTGNYNQLSSFPLAITELEKAFKEIRSDEELCRLIEDELLLAKTRSQPLVQKRKKVGISHEVMVTDEESGFLKPYKDRAEIYRMFNPY